MRSSDDKVEDQAWGQAQEDCRFGSMIEPNIATPELLKTTSVTRRIPILQEKDDGSEKVLIVDHATESWIKEATPATETMQTEGIDVAIIMCLMLMTYGHQLTMAKRDVKRAFHKPHWTSKHSGSSCGSSSPKEVTCLCHNTWHVPLEQRQVHTHFIEWLNSCAHVAEG